LLEAELRASQKAYDVAAAAKASTKKSQKTTLSKAKKAKKALADADKEHAQQEQAVAEHLHTMSTTAESRCFSLSSFFDFRCTVVLVDAFFSSFLLFIVQDLLGYLHRPCQQTMIL
jgi:hypothetical protein